MKIVAYRHDFNLPWDSNRPDSKRFRQWLTVCFFLVAVGGVVIPLLPRPEVDREGRSDLGSTLGPRTTPRTLSRRCPRRQRRFGSGVPRPRCP